MIIKDIVKSLRVISNNANFIIAGKLAGCLIGYENLFESDFVKIYVKEKNKSLTKKIGSLFIEQIVKKDYSEIKYCEIQKLKIISEQVYLNEILEEIKKDKYELNMEHVIECLDIYYRKHGDFNSLKINETNHDVFNKYKEIVENKWK